METMETTTATRVDTYPAPLTKPLAQILYDLRQQIPVRHISRKKVPTKKGGTYEADYMHHTVIRDYLDFLAPGWESSTRMQGLAGKIFVTVTITVHGSDGSISRDGIGNEEDHVDGYGDSSSNAHAMALRRAAMEFGLGRQLWRK